MRLPPSIEFLLAALAALSASCAAPDTGALDGARDAQARLLDGFHAAAARADLEDYLGRMAPGALFVGTDPTEVWTLAEFRAFVAPYFAEGRGWTYHPVERRIDPCGPDAAAFYETLDNAKYGRLRGSGALVRGPEGWRIAHYVLSFQVPNETAPALLELLGAAPGP